MAKKHKILGTIAGLVGVAVIATGVYFAVPKIVNKSWGEILHIGEETPPAETSKLTLNTNGNLTFICSDEKGNTYTEEELEAKEWQGETLTFTLAPNDGYMLWSVKVNDEEVTLDNNMFTVKMDKDVEIDVDVQEIKEYTANIVEDRYSKWQLTVNGEPLSSGDTIHTGDIISGRVISLTSGYKTVTFLINNIEYVQTLDKYGFISEQIQVKNSDNDQITLFTATAKDNSSNVVEFARPKTLSIISTPTYAYTSDICSVYNITSYGLRVGEEVKMDFNIENSDLFGGITLNGDALEVTIAEDGTTAFCTFVVPETKVVLEVVSLKQEEQQIVIPFDYDEETIEVTTSGPGTLENKQYIINGQSVDNSFQATIVPKDTSWYQNNYLVIKVNNEQFVYSSGESIQINIPNNTTNVTITLENIKTTSSPFNIDTISYKLKNEEPEKSYITLDIGLDSKILNSIGLKINNDRINLYPLKSLNEDFPIEVNETTLVFELPKEYCKLVSTDENILLQFNVFSSLSFISNTYYLKFSSAEVGNYFEQINITGHPDDSILEDPVFQTNDNIVNIFKAGFRDERESIEFNAEVEDGEFQTDNDGINEIHFFGDNHRYVLYITILNESLFDTKDLFITVEGNTYKFETYEEFESSEFSTGMQVEGQDNIYVCFLDKTV